MQVDRALIWKTLVSSIYIELSHTIFFLERRTKLILFADVVIVENSKKSTKMLPEIINELSKYIGYRVNMQKSIVSVW